MKPEVRKEMGKNARKWVIDNFSVEVIGKYLEDFLDAAPKVTDFSCFEKDNINPNPYYQIPVIENDDDWILHLYNKILDRPKVDEHDDGFKHWKARINKDVNRQGIEQYFRQVAFQTIQEQKSGGLKFEDFLNEEDKGRVLVVIPEGATDIFLISSLFQSIKTRYPDYALYVATKPQFRCLIDGNPLVNKWLEYNPIMDNLLWLEGRGDQKGYFNIAYLPFLQTQRIMSHSHNGEDKIDFLLK